MGAITECYASGRRVHDGFIRTIESVPWICEYPFGRRRITTSFGDKGKSPGARGPIAAGYLEPAMAKHVITCF